LDILVEPSKENAQRIVKSLLGFGFKSLSLTERDFIQKGKIIQLGYEPVRVDLLTSIRSNNFAAIWKNRKTGKYGAQKVFFIGLAELIKNKKKSRRKQDSVDVYKLMPEKRCKS
jgi:hypothetical protein